MKNSFCKKCLILMPLLMAITLETLPLGAVIREFNPSTKNIHTMLYSYFDITPFGLANFFPFITAILSCVLLLSVFTHVFIRSAKTLSILLCIITLFCSLGPFIFTDNCFNMWTTLISAMFIIETVVLINTSPHR